MNPLTSAVCPRCGAQVQPTPGSEQVTCSYCGTVSFIARPPAQATPRAMPQSSGSPMLWVVLLVVAVILLGGLSLVVMLVSGDSRSSTSPVAPTATGTIAQVQPI